MSREKSMSQNSYEEIYNVLDLCLSCKGCTSECPSNVDMAKIKAEFLYQYYLKNKRPLRNKIFSRNDSINGFIQKLPTFLTVFMKHSLVQFPLKKVFGIASERSIPVPSKSTLLDWYNQNYAPLKPTQPIKSVTLFVDEFTNRLDVEVGQKAIKLLARLGYDILVPSFKESGRAAISKGDLEYARKVADYNVIVAKDTLSNSDCIIGIEPSAILSFRDEYPSLVSDDCKPVALDIEDRIFTFEEFISSEIDKGNITSLQFSSQSQHILIHGHCHQKALSDMTHSQKILSIPEKFTAEIIPSGCCGMAGSFGYEKEHYDLSMQVGEMVLFPKVKSKKAGDVICASGTSCRHQIADGTNVRSMHAAEILFEALLK